MARTSSAAVPGVGERPVVEHPDEVSESLRALAAAELDDLPDAPRWRRALFWFTTAFSFLAFLPASLPFLGWAFLKRRQRVVHRRRLKKRLEEHGFGEGLSKVLSDHAPVRGDDPEGVVERALVDARRLLDAADPEALAAALDDPDVVSRFERVRRLAHNGLTYTGVFAVMMATVLAPFLLLPAGSPWLALSLLSFPLGTALAVLVGRAPAYTLPREHRPIYTALMNLVRRFGSLPAVKKVSAPMLEDPGPPLEDLGATRARHGLAPTPAEPVEQVELAQEETLVRGD